MFYVINCDCRLPLQAEEWWSYVFSLPFPKLMLAGALVLAWLWWEDGSVSGIWKVLWYYVVNPKTRRAYDTRWKVYHLTDLFGRQRMFLRKLGKILPLTLFVSIISNDQSFLDRYLRGDKKTGRKSEGVSAFSWVPHACVYRVHWPLWTEPSGPKIHPRLQDHSRKHGFNFYQGNIKSTAIH